MVSLSPPLIFGLCHFERCPRSGGALERVEASKPDNSRAYPRNKAKDRNPSRNPLHAAVITVVKCDGCMNRAPRAIGNRGQPSSPAGRYDTPGLTESINPSLLHNCGASQIAPTARLGAPVDQPQSRAMIKTSAGGLFRKRCVGGVISR